MTRVYWVTGASAGCEINESLTNKEYDGVFEIDTAYKQKEFEEGIKGGKFMYPQSRRKGKSIRRHKLAYGIFYRQKQRLQL